MKSKLIRKVFIIGLFSIPGISKSSISECNHANNYLLNFKDKEIVVNDNTRNEYRVFKEAHEFLNKVVLRYELFSSNDFLTKKFNDYILRAVFATTKIELIKGYLGSEPTKFIGGENFNKLTHNLLLQMNYLKSNNEKFVLLENLSKETAKYKSAKDNFNMLRQKEQGGETLKNAQNEMTNINKNITKIKQDLNDLDIKPIPLEDHVVLTDFSYLINGEKLSYKDLPNMKDQTKIQGLLDAIDKDLKIILFKNINHLSDYDQSDRLNFLNQSKTFSYAEFQTSNEQKQKYYSISGMNFEFKKPSLELRQKIQDKINNNKINDNEYMYKPESLNERIQIIDTLLKDNIVMVNQFDNYYIPALNTKRRNSDLNKNDLSNTKEFEIFEKLPINEGKKKVEILDEFYDLKNIQSLGEDTLKQFKKGNMVLDKDARVSDSEYKLLNQFLSETIDKPDISGQLTVYTSKPACHSCITGYESFKEQRPNVTLKIMTLTSKLETEMKTNFLSNYKKDHD